MDSESWKREPGTVELLERAASSSAELVRLELALAKDEILEDLAAAKASAIMGAVAVILGLVGLASLCVALGVALGTASALALGGGLLATAAVLGTLAVKKFPTKPLKATTRRLEADSHLLNEHLS